MNGLDYNNNKVVKNFFNKVFQNGFLHLIKRPTRVTRTSVTLVDHILTNRVIENKVHSGITKTYISGHISIFTFLTTNETCTLKIIKSIKRDNENIDSWKFLLQNIKWERILPPNSLDKANETFHFICSDLHDTTFPKRVI